MNIKTRNQRDKKSNKNDYKMVGFKVRPLYCLYAIMAIE